MDDEAIIERNPAAHDAGLALRDFFAPYWPESSGTPAGQYRPVAILWYSMDWMLSGGQAWWFHTVNIVMHALATSLFIMVVARWLPPTGALVAGLIFAVHPVHVEAVANVVGRAEIATAVLLLAALLCGRRYRSSTGARVHWTILTLLLLTIALLIKEHAVVLVALLIVDEFFDEPRGSFLPNLNLYVAVSAVTVAWLFLWKSIAGPLVSTSEIPVIRGLSHVERLATMFPAYFEVLRLLVWPFDLSPDYNPQMIPRRLTWSAISFAGLIVVVSIVALGFLLRRRAPAVAAGILMTVILYAPTSNLLFASGILIAERNLYLCVLAPAVAIGWVASVVRSRELRRVTLTGIGALTFFFAWRTVERVPEWESTERLLVGAFAEHPENYAGHVRIWALLMRTGDSTRALAHGLVARTLFPDDPLVARYTVPLAKELGHIDLAIREVDRSLKLGVDYAPLVDIAVRLRIQAGHLDTALTTARRGMEQFPDSPLVSEAYRRVLDVLDAPSWVQEFAVARDHWLRGQVVAARNRLIDGMDAIVGASFQTWECWEIEQTYPLIRELMPSRTPEVRGVSGQCDWEHLLDGEQSQDMGRSGSSSREERAVFGSVA
jgi:hypothetical protein